MRAEPRSGRPERSDDHAPGRPGRAASGYVVEKAASKAVAGGVMALSLRM